MKRDSPLLFLLFSALIATFPSASTGFSQRTCGRNRASAAVSVASAAGRRGAAGVPADVGKGRGSPAAGRFAADSSFLPGPMSVPSNTRQTHAALLPCRCFPPSRSTATLVGPRCPFPPIRPDACRCSSSPVGFSCFVSSSASAGKPYSSTDYVYSR